MQETIVSTIPFILLSLVSFIPAVRMLKRMGIHSAVAVFTLFPFLGVIVLLWIVAYSKWPRTERSPQSN